MMAPRRGKDILQTGVDKGAVVSILVGVSLPCRESVHEGWVVSLSSLCDVTGELFVVGWDEERPAW